MIDSHCHLGIDEFKQDITGCLLRAKEQGVTHLLTVACSYHDVDDLAFMMKQENVYGAFGIHPEQALTFDYQKSLAVYQKYPGIVAVGEIGLDYFYNKDTKKQQQIALYNQIELAHQLEKPIIIHARDADDDLIKILTDTCKKGLLKKRGVMHCFCGSQQLADVALELGFYISVSGIITFKNAVELRDIIDKIPLNRLMVETDSPYLAPHPLRGRQNEPSYVAHTLKMLATIKNQDINTVEDQTTKNFFDLFIKEEGQ